ncbi:hypothetical protein E1301_Tti023878 [Triplophysa tibetana]|uniref:Uncharacterized protein n=1 Tax=Triplophysa tibetana TaxID=1572043 RepID=A0A5A9PKT3_9TELE|nr:hypothetical protein E1301_Tti020635 [Triplophysa tibetana]KAA0721619.1 hypothetical protein E1301_Tti023878 [Triplophysa tibetana]
MTVTFRVTLFRPCVERFTSSRVDTIASQREVVQREQSESPFAETLRSTFPQLQGGEYELCRVVAQRLVSPLCLDVKTLPPVASSLEAQVAFSPAAPVASSPEAQVDFHSPDLLEDTYIWEEEEEE